MKLLLENWRQYVNEMEEEVIDTLRIFDFDETIARTRSETRVWEPGRSSAQNPNDPDETLTNQEEFDTYMKKAAAREGITDFDPIDALREKGYEIDLEDFSKVIDPREIKIVTDRLKEFPENAKTYIITARGMSSTRPILDYLDSLEIDTGRIRLIATAGESKGAVIANMIAQKRMADGSSNIKDVEYYEDSGKNITDVMNHICPEKLANLTIYKVIHIEDTDEYDLEYVGC